MNVNISNQLNGYNKLLYVNNENIFNNIKDMNLITKIKKQANKLSQILVTKIELTQISDRIYHCPYPTDAHSFKTIINQLGAEKIQVWNLSEYRYPPGIKQALEQAKAEVHELTYQFYASMPLTVSISSVTKIEEFLREGAKNYVLVHCQENKSRSMVFLAIYFYLNGEINDIASALAEVNKKLGIHSNQTVYSSQHLILRNVGNYQRDPFFINKQHLKLLKLIINEAPKVKEVILQEQQPLPLFIQIRRNGKVVYKKITKQFGQGQIIKFNFSQENIILADDCLFSFKYIYKEKAYPVARIQINTNFIFNNFIRIQQQQMDISKSASVKTQVFTDFLFEALPETMTELSCLNKVSQNLDIQSHYERTRKRSPEKVLEQNGVQKAAIKEIKEEKVEKDEEIFNIHDEFEKQKEQQEGKLTQEKIDELLMNISLRNAQVEQKIVEENDSNEEYEKDVTKGDDKLNSEDKEEQKFNNLEKQEQAQVKQQQKQKEDEQKIQENELKQDQQNEDLKEEDIEDYLIALQKQASEN